MSTTTAFENNAIDFSKYVKRIHNAINMIIKNAEYYSIFFENDLQVLFCQQKYRNGFDILNFTMLNILYKYTHDIIRKSSNIILIKKFTSYLCEFLNNVRDQ